ncbi:hypothetical protein D4764_06G0007920 [Takifugu flavidus]|uniref:Reverse transcriptase domain-containing protein n=1 Tax=Takifugu flavidus TaxID=433684 RepID=A0A5C6MVM1_9TELE|nr:hypothetical protein D4764_06G0007920 [Takifugu flavidus]
MRPHYLPREFTHALAVVVYIPPSANANAACDVLLSAVSRLQTQHPDTLLLISGDFNHASPSSSLPKFTQYVTCHTRDNKTLDLFYANTSVKNWSEEAEEALKDCFNTTLWAVFSNAHGEDIDNLTHCISDYINFCVENTVPTRTVQSFSNSKPWITPDIKAILKEKKRAFLSGDKEDMKSVQRKLRRKIRHEKDSYRRKVKHQLQQNSICRVWKGLKTISGLKEHKSQSVEDRGPVSSAATPATVCACNPLLLLYPLPFSHDFQLTSARHFTLWPVPIPPPTPPCSGLSLTTHQVRKALKNRARKAKGLDGISSRLLKSCADQLYGIFSHTFNLSLKLGRVPQLWKTSCIVPVPKTPHPKELSSYRPVALTFHLMKTLGTGVPQGTVLDPFLFTLYTTDFSYNLSSCHLQKFSDDSATINTNKTKELMVDLRRRNKPPSAPVNILGMDVDVGASWSTIGGKQAHL